MSEGHPITGCPFLFPKMPFRSQAQQRFAFGTGQPWAERWADETDFSKLPRRVKRIRSKRVKGCTCGQTLKGEQIAPGITRIHGNLCNVHGKYGPCDAALSGKKPKGGKKPKAPKSAKPKKTDQQRAAERQQAQSANTDKTLTAVGMGDEAASTLLSLAAGESGGGDDFGLIKQGLVERDTQGNLRLSESGRVFLNASKRGDLGAARDALSRGGDRVVRATERTQAAQQRQQATAARRADIQAKRQQREAERAQRAQEREQRRKPSKRTQRRRKRMERQSIASEMATVRREATQKDANPGDYLVVEDREKPSTWHLQVRRNGKPDHGLMGGAWAALHGGYRGNKYAGPGKAAALSKLRALYASEKMPMPSEKATSGDGYSGDRAAGGVHVPSGRDIRHNKELDQTAACRMDARVHAAVGKSLRPHLPQDLPQDQAVVDRSSSSSSIPQFTVYKDASGADRWLAVSSTAYRDRDKEIVSTKALSGAVALADASGYRGPLRFWHVPGVELGDCDYQATAQDGRFLIESGTFRSPALAAAVKSHADEYQMSIGFTHPPDEPDSNGVFTNIAIFERSLVPRGRASNPLTQFALVTKESRMLTAEKQEQLTKLLDGNAELLSGLLGNIATTDKAAQESGVAYKDVPDLRALIREELASLLSEQTEKAAPPPFEEAQPEAEAKADMPMDGEMSMEPEGDENMLNPSEIQAIAAAVVEALSPALNIESKMAGYLNEMKGLMGGLSAQKDAQIANVKETLSEVQAQVADLSGSQPRIMAGGYRPSQASATITTDEKLKEAQPTDDPVRASFGAFMTDLGFGQPGQAGV